MRCTDELQKPGGLDAVLQSGYSSTTGKGPGGQLICILPKLHMGAYKHVALAVA